MIIMNILHIFIYTLCMDGSVDCFDTHRWYMFKFQFMFLCVRVCICWIACWTAHFFWCMRICELYDCDYVHTCFECSPSQFTILYTHTLNHSFINLQDRLNDGHTTIAVHNIKLIFIMNKLVCKNVYMYM